MRKYNAIVPADIGTFIINRNDTGVGWQLSQYGIYEGKELRAISVLLQILRSYRNRDLVAFDLGANIGVISVFMSDLVGPGGKVFAFEAQRILFYMLAGNIAINSKNNVYCFHTAISDAKQLIEIPGFDYGTSSNFGSVEFGGVQKEFIGQLPTAVSAERVEAIPLDDLDIATLDFLKVDVEGMELRVLAGGAETIARHRPIALAEHLKSDAQAMASWFRQRSFRVFSGVGDNFVCIPEEMDARIEGLTEVMAA